MKVGIIGSGMAGLACAEALLKRGVEVHMFEKADQVGGRCGVIHQDGFCMELGAQTFFNGHHRTRALAMRLGLESSCIDHDPAIGMLKRGKIHSFYNTVGFRRFHPIQFLKFDAVSVSQKMIFIRFIAWLLVNRSKYAFENTKDIDGFAHQSLEKYILDHYGNRFFNNFILPVVNTLALTNPKNLSARFGLSLLRDWIEGQWSMMGGVGYLARKLAQNIRNVNLNTPVTDVVADGKKVKILAGKKSGIFDKVVLATDPDFAAKLPILANISNELNQINYAPAVVVIHCMDRRPENIRNNYQIMPHCDEERPFAFVTNSAAKFVGNAPPRGTVLNWVIIGDKACNVLKVTDSEVLEMIEREAHALFLDYAKPLHAMVVRWDKAMVSPGLDYLRQVEKLKGEVVPNIYLAGSYIHGMGVESAVKSGRDAAFGILPTNTPGLAF